MSKKQSARSIALDILLQWEKEEAYSNLLLHQQLQTSKIDERDKRLVTGLVYGTIQRLHTLDTIISKLVRKGKLDHWVKTLLRISLFQLLYFDKIPDRAVLHEAVELAKKRGNIGVGKFVNGVLRGFLRQRDELLPASNPITITERSFAYSFPEWMIENLTNAYGLTTANQIMEACNQVPKISIRINSLKSTRASFLENWHTAQGLSAEPSELSQDGVILASVGNAANHPWFRDGLYTVQDESSMLVAELIDPKAGMHILDACAAPGGKTTHIAEKMGNIGSIIAYDVHAHKVKLIEENAKRLGISMITAKAMDVRDLGEELFNAVLLDAPCSGLGVITRKPDIRWRKTAEEVHELVTLQQQLLDKVARNVKPGGVLIYSTCTWEPAENKEQVEKFLQRNPSFMPDPSFEKRVSQVVRDRAIIGDGWVQLLPHHFHSDGFFIARLCRQ